MPSTCDPGRFQGTSGYVKHDATVVANVTAWEFAAASEPFSWVDDNSGGYRYSMRTVKSGRGTINFYIRKDGNPCTLVEGRSVVLELHLSDQVYISCDATIADVNYEVDVERATLVRGSASFVTNRAYTRANLPDYPVVN